MQQQHVVCDLEEFWEVAEALNPLSLLKQVLLSCWVFVKDTRTRAETAEDRF